jgi:hypothetical protein
MTDSAGSSGIVSKLSYSTLYRNGTQFRPVPFPPIGFFTENGLSAITGFKEATGISENSFGHAVNIYPNPASGKFSISGLPDGARLKISDMQGMVIYTNEKTSDMILDFDLSIHSAGVYLISLEHQNKNSFHKLILQ